MRQNPHVRICGGPGSATTLVYPTGTWGWRYEGHHISQNWTVVDGTRAASSPQFFGTNPAEVRSGPRRGRRVLGREEDQARTLLRSLSAGLRADAMISDTAPRDILTSNQREAAMQDDVGVTHGQLSEGSARGAVVDHRGIRHDAA